MLEMAPDTKLANNFEPEASRALVVRDNAPQRYVRDPARRSAQIIAQVIHHNIQHNNARTTHSPASVTPLRGAGAYRRAAALPTEFSAPNRKNLALV